MKIAIINPSMRLAGGVERVIALQVNAWVEQYNHDVVIITQADSSCTSFYKLNDKVRIVYVGDLIYRNIFDKMRVIRMFRKRNQRISQYKKVIKEEKPDIIISTMQGEENFFLRKIANKTPIIGINHLTLLWRKGMTEKKVRTRIRMYLTYLIHCTKWRKYNAIIALSKTDELNLQRIGCNTYYIPNPSSFPIIHNNKRKNNKQIIMVGRLDYLKGQDRLLKIWKNISNEFPDWKLLLIGNGEMHDTLLDLEKRYNIQNSVIHIYQSNNIQSQLASASIFAFTSRLESFGMVILEAFCCGLPVISYDCENGPRDLVRSNFNGFLIPNDDEQTFTLKLRELILNSALREKMGKNAEITAQTYSINSIMDKWESLLQSLIKK